MYRVIKRFYELQDVTKTKSGDIYHEYKVGDTFPRPGFKVSDARLKELAGENNRRGTPLIEEVKEEPPVKKQGGGA